ncbi:hypothetical protein [Nannocystis sp. SCPEA4]|uniref:hypothetical protein n=1 Tax=Nannocystis sp. SCPEA4 TaxID=2996787 RepID=UPI00226D6B8B|nr:hypothetical protein [Nannocystis sp. SCPEA4]MCY1061760.1 hypothetical protein [Nannocystis sp. SCPEA4]
MTDGADDLGLLLCDGGDSRPILAEGLPGRLLETLPRPERAARGRESLELEALDRDPNDLAAQRWGVIAAEGEDGDQAIEAIRALIEHRRTQQDAEPAVFRVPPDMDAAAALRWKNEVLRDETVSEDRRPRYLLILGDLDRVAVELQHVLAHGSFVGRLHCPTTTGYRDYAEKVVASEQTATSRPRALFYTVQDETPAVDAGYRQLVVPCMHMARERSERGKLDLAALGEIAFSRWGPDEMLDEARADVPSVMLTLSHGLGAPAQGWQSHEQQRALQGALSLGQAAPLTADMVRERSFLPGGVWMPIACFAAGTPPTSAFYSWLALLAERDGQAARAQAVLRSLPRAGERPFVAALPQALLANPHGPLAVIGHMDLAWTFGFIDAHTSKSRASRVFATLRTLLAGGRVGVALDALMQAYREVNDELMARYQLQRDALAHGLPDPAAPRTLGTLWMQRNDLRGYVLLGDPAARLAIGSSAHVSRDRAREARGPATASVADSRTDASGNGRAEVYRRERAVLALLRGDETPRAIAAQFGLRLDELFDLADAYRAAGRRSLHQTAASSEPSDQH